MFTSPNYVFQLRALGKKFCNNDLLQEELAAFCRSEHITVKKMVRPVDTRWNTMCDVIVRAIELRPALDRLLVQPKHNKGPVKKQLGRLLLSSAEWDLLDLLKPTLLVCIPSLSLCFLLTLFQIFQYATKRMSASGRPLLADVIPVIDILTQRLETVIADDSQPAIICASAAKARSVLNKYYSKTDDSQMYRMAMSMFF